MMTLVSHLGWPVAILLAWILAWITLYHPLLARIRATMGLTAGASLLEGSKTVLASFAVSVFAIGKTCLDVLSENTDLLDGIKDQFPWTTWVSADTALKIVSISMLGITFLHLYGKLRAAATPPQQ